jgi:hypothetical protein
MKLLTDIMGNICYDDVTNDIAFLAFLDIDDDPVRIEAANNEGLMIHPSRAHHFGYAFRYFPSTEMEDWAACEWRIQHPAYFGPALIRFLRTYESLIEFCLACELTPLIFKVITEKYPEYRYYPEFTKKGMQDVMAALDSYARTRIKRHLLFSDIIHFRGLIQ